MKTLKALFRIPLFLLILYLVSVTGYEVIRPIQNIGIANLDWRFYAYALQGALELVLLIWIYRWLGPQSDQQRSKEVTQHTWRDAPKIR